MGQQEEGQGVAQAGATGEQGAQDALLAGIGTAVRAARLERGWTLKELAEAAELSARFVSQLEAGRGNIAIGRLARVAAALELSLADLVEPPRRAEEARIRSLLRGRSRAQLRRGRRALERAFAARPPLLALLGMRGAGKSSLGAGLAAELGVEFVELDERIEASAGLSLGELFNLHGEAFVRRLETKCLGELLDAGRPAVVALPGGVVGNPEAWELLHERALSVWLQATPEDHMQRVLDQGDRRPMAGSEDAMSELRAILAAREPLYREADLHLDTSRESSRAAAQDHLLELVRASGWPQGAAG